MMSNDLSPLSIALDLYNKELIECMVSEIAILSQTDKRIVHRIEPDLPRLNLASPPSLSKIYDVAYQVVHQSGLKKYGVLKNPSGMMVTSLTYLIDEKNFLDKNLLNQAVLADDTLTSINLLIDPDNILHQNAKNTIAFIPETNLVYRVSSFRMNFSAGSIKSIEFLDSLFRCTDNDVFKAKIIQDIINYKWESARYFIYLYNFIIFCNLAVVLIYQFTITSYFVIFDSLMATFNTILFVYECLQMSVGTKGYLSSIWNMVDLIRIIIVYVYAFVDYEYSRGDHISHRFYESIVGLVVFLLLLRGFSTFECYSRTRSIIKIFLEIINSSMYLLIILVCAIMALSFLLISLNVFEGNSFLKCVSTMYNLNFGGFDASSYPGLTISWFYLATLVGPLIMINLLVSIMNETFETSSENLITQNLKALLERIIEIESVLLWRKGYGKPSYLQCCSSEINEEDPGDKQTEKIRVLSEEVEILQGRMRELGKYCKVKNTEMTAIICKTRQQEINYRYQLIKDQQQLITLYTEE